MIRKLVVTVSFLLCAAVGWAAELPAGIKWETNTADPPIGDIKALKGGTFNYYIQDYPLTLRLYGPNNNDAFASWNRSYTLDFALVARHPVTDNFIPWMATHWSIQDDHKTIYYKLDTDARWSDGKPVTADDYVFAFEMMGSKEIVDPAINLYVRDYLESVEAVDPHTLKVVGKKPSWRPLSDYNLSAMPRHAIKLGPNWVQEATNTPPVAQGPYVITETVPGQRVVFEKVKNWWGEDKGYFKGLYNVDRIVLRVIPQERALDYFQNGDIDLYFVTTARIWAQGLGIPSINNGWAHRKRIFTSVPAGIGGLAMNLQAPIFQNKDFRKAMQYLVDFEKLNSNLMFNAYFRKTSAFEGTEYANPGLKPYGYNPRAARDHLVKAGYTRRGSDGILVNGQGQRASFTLIYGTKGFEPHLTMVQQAMGKMGVEMSLKLLEGATSFNRALERKYEMILINYTSGFYPEPHQFFHSDLAKETNNNNVWGFGTPETDKLIDTYRFNMDKQARLDAMHKLDSIIQDEAFYIPLWDAPYIRLVYWDQVGWPEFFVPKRTEYVTDWQTFWIDPARAEKFKAARAGNQPYGEDKTIDVDPWGVKAELEAKTGGAAATQPASEPVTQPATGPNQ